MKHSTPTLQLCIHNVDGTATTFVRKSATEASWVPDEFQPARIFCREWVTLTGENFITSFPVSQITRIELTCEQLPHPAFPACQVEGVELTKEQFQALIRNPVMRNQWDQPPGQHTSLVTFMEVQMADGQCLYLTTETPAEAQSQLWQTKGIPLDGAGLCYRTRMGGVAILNLAHLARVTFFPKPPQAPTDAWPDWIISSSSSTEHLASYGPGIHARVNLPPATFSHHTTARPALNKTN